MAAYRLSKIETHNYTFIFLGFDRVVFRLLATTIYVHPVFLLCHCSACSCYYTSRVCKYFIDGECYENYTVTNNTSTCDAVAGYLLKGHCYYHVPRNCSAGEYLLQCTCYSHRSSTYSNNTCYNIGGFYTDDYCYYVDFNCSGYAVNNQCYTSVSMK